MQPPHRDVSALPVHLRLGACLLHAVPGAVGAIDTRDGVTLRVAQFRNDAALTPCQLRAGLLHPVLPGVAHLADVVRSIEIVGGVIDVGGGLYERTTRCVSDERWFVTTLHSDRIAALAADCPMDDHDVDVRLCADFELGASAVCLQATPAVGLRLDLLAAWLHEQCLVDELLESARPHRTSDT